jgi:hypothetical protein
MIRDLLRSTSSLALLGWDGRFDLSAFTLEEWDGYRGADCD